MPLITQAASPTLGFSFGVQEPHSEAAYVMTGKSQVLINAWSKFQHVTNAQASEAFPAPLQPVETTVMLSKCRLGQLPSWPTQQRKVLAAVPQSFEMASL